MYSRRLFLKGSALAMAGLGAAPAWLSRAVYAAETPARRKKVLVAVFQRGAADGLNIVVPYGDQRYYQMRPSIAIPKPDGGPESAVDLDGHFGLHPSLAALKPVFDSKQLAIVEAVGSPDPTRSHFDAQDYMESGTPGLKATVDGWLNRAMLPELRTKSSPLRAVSLGPELPRSLRGRNDAVAVASIRDFHVADDQTANIFESMYDGSKDQILNGTGRETFEALKIVRSLQKNPYVPDAGAVYPKGRMGQSLQQIAQLIKADVGLEVAFTDLGGWDNHVNEVGGKPSQGPLANALKEFGDALAAFHRDLGPRMEDVMVVTMSEFGRTAHENGNRGTDHGHANVMFVMGGEVQGGAIHGKWPGLADHQLYEGRDLALTTDFRDVLGEVVSKHLGNGNVASVFPGYTSAKFRGIIG
jgi:uncharacterized protein (DUF1501 family)